MEETEKDYNDALLSRLLEIKEDAGEAEQVTHLGRVSPIACSIYTSTEESSSWIRLHPSI